MHTIMQIPKTALVYCAQFNTLRVTNYKVDNMHGLLHWLIVEVKSDGWDYTVHQLIQQGFRFESFIEHCITDMYNPKKFGAVIYTINKRFFENMPGLSERCYYIREIDDVGPVRYVVTPGAKRIALEIEKWLGKCKNYDMLHTELMVGGNFHKKINEKILEEIKQ